MEITIRSFAMIREVLGNKFVRLTVQNGSRVSDAMNHLIILFPRLENLLKTNNVYNDNFKIIINDEEVNLTTIIRDNDTLVILPPTGGG